MRKSWELPKQRAIFGHDQNIGRPHFVHNPKILHHPLSHTDGYPSTTFGIFSPLF
jgi:hypothetical protein